MRLLRDWFVVQYLGLDLDAEQESVLSNAFSMIADAVLEQPQVFVHRDYHSRSYDAPMPFSLFITNTGVALHASPMSSRRATHGCIGLPDGFAEKLFEAAKVGDVVEIVRSPISRTNHTALRPPA